MVAKLEFKLYKFNSKNLLDLKIIGLLSSWETNYGIICIMGLGDIFNGRCEAFQGT